MRLPMPAILRGDARNLPLPDASVDLVVTSPPYFGLRSYTDGGEHYDGQLGSEPTPAEFVDALIECTREMVRVLRSSGSIFVNLGDRFSGAQGQTQTGINGRRHVTDSAATWRQTDPRRTGIPNKSLMLLPERYRVACVDELGLIVRAVIVWSKANGMPESVTDRVRRSHEDWVHLTKSPRYFAAVDEIREPHTMKPQRRPNGRPKDSTPRPVARQAWSTAARDEPSVDGNPLGKLPGSVWSIATQSLRIPDHIVHALCCDGRPRPGCQDGINHYAAFPFEFPRRLIKGWCPPGGVVIDPFGGTGTTALVATMHGRHGISVDLSADYCRLAQWRATDPKERARAAGLDPDAVARVKPEQAGQVDLFGEAS